MVLPWSVRAAQEACTGTATCMGKQVTLSLVHLTSLCLLIHFLIGIHAVVKWPQVTAQQLISSVTLASASNSF